MRRFPIKRSSPRRAILALMGVTSARAYPEIDLSSLIARFGRDRPEVPRAQIPAHWHRPC